MPAVTAVTAVFSYVNNGNNYEDVSNSAELEQVVEQENKDCEFSACTNAVVLQTQLTGGGLGGAGAGGLLGGSAVATAGLAAATATGGSGGNGGSGGDGGVKIVNNGNNFEDVSNSAEVRTGSRTGQ